MTRSFIVCCLLLLSAFASAGAGTNSSRALPERFLSADGLVPAGAGARGALAVASDPADTAWDARFDTLGGLDNIAFAVAVDGENVYVGGQFTTAGGITVNGIARWDGAAWHALGAGMDNIVRAIAVDGANVYAAGQFTTAGGVTTNGVARWDGAAWHALGTGMDGIVYALAVYNGELYAGGLFTTAGGVPAQNIARWNGSAWNALGAGMNSYVFAFAVRDGELIVGGDFTLADDVEANRIASLHGGLWSELGDGLDSYVLALTVVGSDLVAGGNFEAAGGAPASRIARWNGSTWSALGSGVNNYVFSLTSSGPALYAGGYFTIAGGAPAATIARYAAGSWSPLGSGTSGYSVFALGSRLGSLYAGGTFSSAGEKPSMHFGRWSIAPFQISASAGPGGAITPSGDIVVENGADALFQFQPDEGLHVDSILVDGGFAGDSLSYRFRSVYADHAIRVAFATNVYAITAEAGPHGAVSPSGAVAVAHGLDAAFTFLPDPGYHVDSILVDGAYAGDSLSYRFLHVTAPHALAIRFARNTFTIDASAGSHGTVTPSGLVTVVEGGDTLFQFTSDAGFHVDSILVDGAYAGDSLAYRFSGVTAHHTLRVAFDVNVYDVVVSAGPHGSAAPSGTTVVAHGSGLEITFTPDLGYELDSILVDGAMAGAASPFMLSSVTAPRTVHGTFRVASPYQARYRTASYEDWALATDQKGKPKSVKRKADKVFLSFLLIAPAPGSGFTLSADMLISGVVSSHGVPLGSPLVLQKKAEFPLVAYAPGDTFRFEGVGVKGRPLSAVVEWGTIPRPLKIPVSLYLRNTPGYPAPNLHNAGEELFGFGQSPSFPTGLVVGIPQGAKKGSSVVHLSYKDVQKSMMKSIKGVPLVHHGAPACIDTFPSNRKAITRQLKSLPPDKFSNALFAELLTLRMNIAASAAGKFPAGFGELTFLDPVDDNPFNGRMVSQIALSADSMISCRPVALSSPATLTDLADLLEKLNGAFRSGALDTVSFVSKTAFAGAVRLIDVPFLRVTPGVSPVTVASSPVVEALPEEFRLDQNYPNPFNPATSIRFSLGVPATVSLRVYDVLGRVVATLLDAEELDEGEQEVSFDARALASGVYMCRLEAAGEAERFSSTKKMMLLR
jgi:hypothetical protein